MVPQLPRSGEPLQFTAQTPMNRRRYPTSRIPVDDPAFGLGPSDPGLDYPRQFSFR
jgi:hypothetical protein